MTHFVKSILRPVILLINNTGSQK